MRTAVVDACAWQTGNAGHQCETNWMNEHKAYPTHKHENVYAHTHTRTRNTHAKKDPDKYGQIEMQHVVHVHPNNKPLLSPGKSAKPHIMTMCRFKNGKTVD